MDINTIKQAIQRGGFTNSELQTVINFTRSTMELQTKSSINVGDDVWVVQKTKRTPGVVTKVNIKRAIVKMQGTSYNVPLNMIEVA
jgi:hypothetical protein|tara:strand:- start:454 stop:711 length:258 start_codon:yes stop_codon:yes gene_type:complete